MNSRTVWLSDSEGMIEFYTDGFYWRDLPRFIPASNAVEIILLACSDKELNSIFIDQRNGSPSMELFQKPQSFETIKHFIDTNELKVEEFEIQEPGGMIIKQPMWEDLLFTAPKKLSNVIKDVLVKSELSHQLISFMHLHLGTIISIDESNMPTIRQEFTTLEQYLDYKYDNVNAEINNELNKLIGGK